MTKKDATVNISSITSNKKPAKKPFYTKWWFWVIVALVFLFIITPESPKQEDNPESNTVEQVTDERSDAEDTEEKKIMFGELLSETEGCKEYDDDLKCKSPIMVIKVKISPSYNNKSTVNQNYHNAAQYVKTVGKKYDEIQYWAVADMTNGKESKVISFTLNKRTIELLTGEKIAALQLKNYAEDVWIHKSLREDKN